MHRGWLLLFTTGLSACGAGEGGFADVPDLVPPEDAPADYTLDPATGLLTSRTRILVLLREGAGIGEVADLAEVIGGDPALGILMLRVPDSGGLDAIEEASRRVAMMSNVEHAVPDVLLSPAIVPEIPVAPELTLQGDDVRLGADGCRTATFDWTWEGAPGGSNWGQEWANFPAAWSFDDAIARRASPVTVAVLDSRVDVRHPELAERVTVVGEVPDVDDHGTEVAGVIAANSDNRTMINGVAPFARVLNIAAPPARSLGMTLEKDLRQISDDRPDVRVVNFSRGYNPKNARARSENKPCGKIVTLEPASAPEHEARVEIDAAFTLRAVQRLAARVPPIFVVAAAGNDSLTPEDLSPDADEAARKNQAGWARYEARFSNPFCFNRVASGAPNVFCVEALAPVSSPTLARRASFSNVGGDISAPGAEIATLTRCQDDCLGAKGATHVRGTSFAAPHVAGLIAHVLAFAPDTSVDGVRRALLDHATAGDGVAPGIEAFETMRSLPGALAALLDVDDGTEDGDDRSTAEDKRGSDGIADMRDFRRVRDAFLWMSGMRAALSSGAGAAKMDLNRDGKLGQDDFPEVYPRFDMNGDGRISREDAEVFAEGDVWKDPDAPARVLPELLVSGDLHLDARAVFAAGARQIEVSASGAPYAVKLRAGERRIYTVPAGALTVTARVVEGDMGVAIAPKTVTLGAGEDRDVALTPGTSCTLPPIRVRSDFIDLRLGRTELAPGEQLPVTVVLRLDPPRLAFEARLSILVDGAVVTSAPLQVPTGADPVTLTGNVPLPRTVSPDCPGPDLTARDGGPWVLVEYSILQRGIEKASAPLIIKRP